MDRNQPSRVNFDDAASITSQDTVNSNQMTKNDLQEKDNLNEEYNRLKYIADQREQQRISVENENKKLIEELNLIRAQLEAERQRKEALEAKEREEAKRLQERLEHESREKAKAGQKPLQETPVQRAKRKEEERKKWKR